MTPYRLPRLLGWFLLLAPLAAGCGSSETTARGSIVRDGSPFKFEPTDAVTLEFTTDGGPTGRAFAAQVLPDGTFTVSGATGGGIPPGQYRVVLFTRHYGPPPTNPDGTRTAPGDKFEGVFSDPGKTPLVVDLVGGKQDVTIDVGRKTATAK